MPGEGRGWVQLIVSAVSIPLTATNVYWPDVIICAFPNPTLIARLCSSSKPFASLGRPALELASALLDSSGMTYSPRMFMHPSDCAVPRVFSAAPLHATT